MNVAFVFMNDTPTVGRGAGYVAGAIAAAGYPVTFFDSNYTPLENIAGQVIAGSAEILMISTMTMNFPMAVSLIRDIKKSKTIPVLVGGIHPTIEGAVLLERHPEIDFLCIGEGESMVIEFLRCFSTDSLFNIKNLCYRKNGKVFCNPIRLAEDLSMLPAFPWHFFREDSIGGAGKGFLYVTASRGCPYNCTYCCNGIYLKLYGKHYIRFRPIENVIAELRFLKEKYPSPLYYFGDEMILADPQYAKALFSEVKNALDVPYGLMARVEFVTPDMAAHLRDTGCKYVAMGIECGDEDFRKKHLNRFHSNDQIINAFAALKNAGIFRSSFNIIGYPFDNDRALTKTTIRLNKRIVPDYAYFTIFYPFPGTALYDYCIKYHLIDDERLQNTRQYYQESVLKNVYLKKKCARISRRFNSVIPFETIFDIHLSGKGFVYSYFKRLQYLNTFLFKQLLKRLLGKNISARLRSLMK
jgi:anaerobic magnesium-protoporphyrin IX monomethyl ester cyclase